MMSRKNGVRHIIKALVTVVTLVALTSRFRVIQATFAQFIAELVAGFANLQNLLKYEEKTHVCVASTLRERTGKIYSDHAHPVPRSVAACHASF